VVGFYLEVTLQKREAEGTVRTKHQLNLDPDPEGTQKNLDVRRYGGREEQRIPHVGGGAGAAQGVAVLVMIKELLLLLLAPPFNPMSNIKLGLGLDTLPVPNRAQRNRVGFDSFEYL
jgi:hypothetical protein